MVCDSSIVAVTALDVVQVLGLGYLAYQTSSQGTKGHTGAAASRRGDERPEELRVERIRRRWGRARAKRRR